MADNGIIGEINKLRMKYHNTRGRGEKMEIHKQIKAILYNEQPVMKVVGEILELENPSIDHLSRILEVPNIQKESDIQRAHGGTTALDLLWEIKKERIPEFKKGMIEALRKWVADKIQHREGTEEREEKVEK